MVLGIIRALAFGEKMEIVRPTGIKMLRIPIVMCSIITAIAAMSDADNTEDTTTEETETPTMKM